MKAVITYNTGETNITLKETFNPEGSLLRKCQLRMLEMLIYIDKICNQLDIPYILDGGTLLGAVRHGGFIPWDDDTDIAIPRQYFSKLNKYLEENPHPQFVIQNSRTDKGYMAPWAVLRDTKSEYIQDLRTHNIRKYRGLQIDIFPLEETFGPNIHRFSARLQNVLINKLIRKDYIGCARLGYLLCYKIIFPLFRVVSKLNRNNRLMYPLGASWGYVLDKNLFQNRSLITFEGHKFYGPENIDRYLKGIYGNYMDLPPVNMRNQHLATYVIFD